jgi:2-polyprenyl-3-methyl-5-hydroxy-6-metoxy-1,4-benzoquinol methylase
MPELPPPEVYEKEFQYMPWGKLIQEVISYVTEHAPKKGEVLDLMCGPGHLANKLYQARPDLTIHGIDIDERFISYARKVYHDRWKNFVVADALDWNPSSWRHDIVVCTGSLHHIAYEQQETLVAKIARGVEYGGFAICADPYIDDYVTEQERQLAAAKLGYEYLVATINNGATIDVTKATAALIENDVAGIEFKTSVKRMRPIFEKYFSHVDEKKIWPAYDSEYGDYLFILTR